jgi:hypothetical protein
MSFHFPPPCAFSEVNAAASLDLQPVDLLLWSPLEALQNILNVLSVRTPAVVPSCRKNVVAVEPRELLFWSTKENDDDGFRSSLFLIVLI